MLAATEIVDASKSYFKPLLSFACQAPVLQKRPLAVLGEIELPTRTLPRALAMPSVTLFSWLKKGWLQARQVSNAPGSPNGWCGPTKPNSTACANAAKPRVDG